MLRSPIKISKRSLASVKPAQPHVLNAFQIFDRRAKQLQKNRGVTGNGPVDSAAVDYLREEVADRMFERFLDVKRTFNSILDLGSGPGHFSKLLPADRTKSITMLDSSPLLLHRDPDTAFQVPVSRVCADEERLLETIEPNSQEGIVSCLNMHWINDLPGILVQINRALKPDGLFMGAMLGGETLFELRTALQLAEVDRESGISPHVSPMTQSNDMSNLLTRSGFTMTTVDVDEVRVAYPSMWELMDDLRAMGESNAVIGRRSFLHRDTLAAASAIYKELHGQEDGTVPATFQIIYMIGWKPEFGGKIRQRGAGLPPPREAQ